MANIYVRSTDGSNADSGATWALAKLDLTGAAAIAAVGDTIYVSQNHAESTATGVTITFPGTLASSNKIFCVNDSAEPPTALATTGTVSTTGTNGIALLGALYCEGLTFNVGIGGGSCSMNLNTASVGSAQRYKNCNFNLVNNGSAGAIAVGANASVAQTVDWENCNCSFGNATQKLAVNQTFHWNGGAVTAGGTLPTNLISFQQSTPRPVGVLVEGVDLSLLGSGKSFANVAVLANGFVVFRNTKLGASVVATTGTWPGPGGIVKIHNSDSADTNYRMEEHRYIGSVVSETTIVRTGGASDGTTPLSWKMTTSADAEYPLLQLELVEISRAYPGTAAEEAAWSPGASKTITVEIVHDSQGAGSGSKFQDDEIWLETQYLGTSGFPISASASDVKANVFATAANQADSTETWTTTGLTTPVKQALSVSITPQEKGYILAKVIMAKASKTCYVCPELVVT